MTSGAEPAGQTAGPAPPQAAPAPQSVAGHRKTFRRRPSRIASALRASVLLFPAPAQRRAAPPWPARCATDRHWRKKPASTAAATNSTIFGRFEIGARHTGALAQRTRSENKWWRQPGGGHAPWRGRPGWRETRPAPNPARRGSCPRNTARTCFQPRPAVVSLVLGNQWPGRTAY